MDPRTFSSMSLEMHACKLQIAFANLENLTIGNSGGHRQFMRCDVSMHSSCTRCGTVSECSGSSSA